MTKKVAHSELVSAAERLMRVDEGESIGSVYPDRNGGECSTTLADTELLCDAWIDEHMDPDNLTISVSSSRRCTGRVIPDLTEIEHVCEWQRRVAQNDASNSETNPVS